MFSRPFGLKCIPAAENEHISQMSTSHLGASTGAAKWHATFSCRTAKDNTKQTGKTSRKWTFRFYVYNYLFICGRVCKLDADMTNGIHFDVWLFIVPWIVYVWWLLLGSARSSVRNTRICRPNLKRNITYKPCYTWKKTKRVVNPKGSAAESAAFK